jgi:hypothetical protein
MTGVTGKGRDNVACRQLKRKAKDADEDGGEARKPGDEGTKETRERRKRRIKSKRTTALKQRLI